MLVGVLSQTCHLVYQFLLRILLFLIQGWDTGALILESYIFLYLTEGRVLICSRFYVLG